MVVTNTSDAMGIDATGSSQVKPWDQEPIPRIMTQANFAGSYHFIFHNRFILALGAGINYMHLTNTSTKFEEGVPVGREDQVAIGPNFGLEFGFIF